MQKNIKKKWIVYVLIAQAFLGVVGSLYMSSYGDPIANMLAGNIFPLDSGLLPCTLCWFGRILFYPILPIALVGYLKSDTKFVDYILPLSVAGIFLTGYQYATQKLGLHLVSECSTAVPCDEIQLEYFGFMTIPFLAFAAFIFITVLALWYRNMSKD